MQLDKNQQVFFELLRAGLWGKDARLSQYKAIDYSAIMRLAEEQSVVGLVAAGLEHVKDVIVPQVFALQFAGQAIQLEQRNKAMNAFVAKLIEHLRKEDVYAILVKGQGVAQCYERPLWRACGDVDLLLSEDSFIKANNYLKSLSSSYVEEKSDRKHVELTINNWVIELHGTLHGGLWFSIDKTLDDIQKRIFYGGNVRSWVNGTTQVFLPAANEDVVFIFSHILQHFFQGGIGLRQVCDWCRLLWTFKDSLNHGLLESRIREMGVMTEWKTFAALAVDYLGMPVEAMPFYSHDKKWKRKVVRVMVFVLETGNFGHNRDKSYYRKHNYVVYKAISLWRNTWDSMRHFMIFPWDSTKVWFRMIGVGVSAVAKGR